MQIRRKDYNGQTLWSDEDHFWVRRSHETGHLDLFSDGEVSASQLREIGAALISIADEIDPPHSEAEIEQEVQEGLAGAIALGWIEEVEPGKYRMTPTGEARIEELKKGQNNS